MHIINKKYHFFSQNKPKYAGKRTGSRAVRVKPAPSEENQVPRARLGGALHTSGLYRGTQGLWHTDGPGPGPFPLRLAPHREGLSPEPPPPAMTGGARRAGSREGGKLQHRARAQRAPTAATSPRARQKHPPRTRAGSVLGGGEAGADWLAERGRGQRCGRQGAPAARREALGGREGGGGQRVTRS